MKNNTSIDTAQSSKVCSYHSCLKHAEYKISIFLYKKRDAIWSWEVTVQLTQSWNTFNILLSSTHKLLGFRWWWWWYHHQVWLVMMVISCLADDDDGAWSSRSSIKFYHVLMMMVISHLEHWNTDDKKNKRLRQLKSLVIPGSSLLTSLSLNGTFSKLNVAYNAHMKIGCLWSLITILTIFIRCVAINMTSNTK